MSTMQNLFSEEQTAEEKAFSVSQISQMIAGTLNDNFNDITVKGEISGFKAAASGHMYFSIKDGGNSSVLAVSVLKSNRKNFPVKPNKGPVFIFSPYMHISRLNSSIPNLKRPIPILDPAKSID